MKLDEFYDKVSAHPELTGISINASTQEFLIGHDATTIATVVPAAAVEAQTWLVLEEILTAVREPQVLYHLSRVVGYYSRTENWNPSKLAELRDRQRGDYAVEGGEGWAKY